MKSGRDTNPFFGDALTTVLMILHIYISPKMDYKDDVARYYYRGFYNVKKHRR